MLLYLYHLFFGYLYVRVTTTNPEKLLNVCATNGITVWRVALRKDKLYFKIGINSFKKLRLYKRNISAKIHITKKVGFPFFVSKNRYRYGVLAGVISFFVILNFMSGFAWNICVNGNTTVKSEEILKSLREIGIYEGVEIKSINPAQKSNDFLLKQKGISWAAINIEGSKITVDLTESETEQERDTSPSNLKSKCDGVIKKIEVLNGTVNVKVGDAVEKGDLLVSGVKEYNDLSTKFVRARGKIYAETETIIHLEQPLKVTEHIKTGEVETLSAIKLFGVNIPLYLGRVEGEYWVSKYETEVSSGEAYLPIEKVERTFYKIKKTTYNITRSEGEKRLKEKGLDATQKWCEGGEITYKKETIICEKGILKLKIEIRCIKDIVLEEKIQIDTSN